MNKDLNSTLMHAEQQQNRQYKIQLLVMVISTWDVQLCTEQPYGKCLQPLIAA